MGFNVLDTLNSKSRQQAQTGQLSNWYANMTYEETKAGIRDGITKIKESFVEVGYYLRKIQRTEEYKADGYKDIWEFADQEYGLHRSTASRWMSINQAFSQNGESPYLKEEYRRFSKSQLQEMLYLEEDTRQLITKKHDSKGDQRAAKNRGKHWKSNARRDSGTNGNTRLSGSGRRNKRRAFPGASNVERRAAGRTSRRNN